MAVDRSEAHQGDTVRLQFLFTLSDAAFDPHEIRQVEILDSNLNVLATFTGSEIVRETLGQYHVDWSIPLDEPATIHHDRWFATAFDGGTEKVFTPSFQVLTFGGASSTTPYITLAEAREVIPEVTEITDSQLQELVLVCQEIIERICGQSFLPIQATRTFDGTGRPVLPIRRPIHTVSEVRVLSCGGGTDYAIDVDSIRVMGSRTMLGIGNVQTYEQRLFGGPARYPWQSFPCGIFPSGLQNIAVTGLWGAYDSVPRPIKRALTQLLRYTAVCDDPFGIPTAALESEETAGDRRFTLRKIYPANIVQNMTGYPDVDTILSLYKHGVVAGVV